MRNQQETFRCVVTFESGEKSPYANLENLLEFISFINDWYIDWETIKVYSEKSGDFVEELHAEDYLEFKGIEYNPGKWVNLDSWDY